MLRCALENGLTCVIPGWRGPDERMMLVGLHPATRFVRLALARANAPS